MPVSWVRSITTENNFNYGVRRHSKGEKFEKTIFENNFPVSVSTITKSEECLLFTHLFVNLFVFFACCVASIYTHIRPCVQLKSRKIFILLFSRKHCLNRMGMTDKFFATNCCIFFRIYLLKMSSGKRRTGPKLKNFLGNMVLDSPSLDRLLHSYFSFRASAPKSHATPKVFVNKVSKNNLPRIEQDSRWI